VRMPVPHTAAPWIDVRRNEADQPLAIFRWWRRLCVVSPEALLVEEARELSRIFHIGSSGVRRRAKRRLRELTFDLGPCRAKPLAVEEETPLELGREAYHELDLDRLAQLSLHARRDLRARLPPCEARHDRHELGGNDRMLGCDA